MTLGVHDYFIFQSLTVDPVDEFIIFSLFSRDSPHYYDRTIDVEMHCIRTVHLCCVVSCRVKALSLMRMMNAIGHRCQRRAGAICGLMIIATCISFVKPW